VEDIAGRILFGRTVFASGLCVAASALWFPAKSYADDHITDSCPKLPFFYAVPNVGCLYSRTDAKAAYWQDEARAVIEVQPGHNNKGPTVVSTRRQLGANESGATWLAEVKSLLSVTAATPYGPVTTSLGGKIQIRTQPSSPDDFINAFNERDERFVLERAGVEFAGFSLGLMPSVFDFTPTLSYTTSYASELSVPLLAYTYQIGTTDFTLSVENGSYRETADPLWGKYTSRAQTDFVGAVRKRFDWGNLKFAAAAHPVSVSQPDWCCTRAPDNGIGWAALAGVETWFEIGGYSTEFLANVGAAKGGLSYLGLTDFPADFAIMRSGDLGLSTAQAAVISAALWWTKELRTVLTGSGYKSTIDMPTFSLTTRAMQAQAAFEYYPSTVPRRGLLFGFEVSYHDEHTGGASDKIAGEPVSNSYITTLLYTRMRF
jgi:hypothetical protein